VARSGTGRIAVSVIASKDGSKIYSESNITATWAAEIAKTGSNARVVPLGKIRRLENTSFYDLPSPDDLPESSPMKRSKVEALYRLSRPGTTSALAFRYPLGAASPVYTFDKVIQFDPQGTAKLVRNTNFGFANQWIAIEFVTAKGNTVPPSVRTAADANTGNIAALQINGLTGAVNLFRP
jgi:hypothetical protein